MIIFVKTFIINYYYTEEKIAQQKERKNRERERDENIHYM